MQRINWKILFLIIIFLAAFLRLYRLGDVPSGFHFDEASFGYNAYSILQTGKDENGNIFPLALKSFGDYKPALYAYFDLPFILIFGLTPFSVRILSALFGIFTVILIFFLTRKLIGNRKIALLSSLLLAVSPWHLNLSRTVTEAVVSVFFLILMIYSFLELKTKFNKFWFVLALVASFFSIMLYTASRFFVIIIAGAFLIFSIKKIKGKLSFTKSIFSIFILILLIGIIYNSVATSARFNQLNIFSHPETKLVLEEQIREDQFTQVYVTRTFHNKFINYGRTIIRNYSDYFSLNFLVLDNYYPERIKVPAAGLFYFWEIPFLLVGIYSLLKRKEKIGIFLIFLWFALIFPASITFDEIPNVNRTLITLPIILIMIAVGLYESYKFLIINKNFRKITFSLILIIIFFEFLFYEHQYFNHQDKHKPWYRNYPAKELVTNLKMFYPSYKKFVITNNGPMSYIFILYYDKYDPEKFQKLALTGDMRNFNFDKYYFVSVDCPLTDGKDGKGKVYGEVNTIYVNNVNCVIPIHNAKLLKTIYWGDNSPAFNVLEFVPTNLPE